jgi:hypothetical protein
LREPLLPSADNALRAITEPSRVDKSDINTQIEQTAQHAAADVQSTADEIGNQLGNIDFSGASASVGSPYMDTQSD